MQETFISMKSFTFRNMLRNLSCWKLTTKDDEKLEICMMFCAVSLQHKITLAGMTSQSLRNLIACPRATVTFTWAWLIRNLICSISRSTSQEYLRTMGCRFLVQLLSPEYKQNDLIENKIYKYNEAASLVQCKHLATVCAHTTIQQ